MKKLSYLMSIALIGMAGIFSSCNKTEEEKTPEFPIKSISVKCQGETVNGVVNDEKKTVTFTFANAENFSSADLIVEVNEGWTLTYPTVLTGVDLQSAPVLNFTDPKSAKVRYTIAFSSNAFPIVDESKIQIEGFEPGQGFTIDNGTKTISIIYDQETMDFNNITLIFGEGSLQAGVEVPSDLSYDFSDGMEQPLVLKLGGDRPYTVKLDVTAYTGKSLSEMGFLDVSSDFVDATVPYVHVYSASILNSVPVYYAGGTMWAPSNPREWEYEEDLSDGSHYHYYNDAFSFPGDWTEDRPTMNCLGKLAIVYIDQDKVKGGITENLNLSKTLGDFNNLVTVSGCKNGGSIKYMVYDENKTLNIQDVAYRASVGFDANGKMSFANAAARGDVLYNVPFQTTFASDEGVETQTIADASTDEWKVKDAAWMYGWSIHNGKALKVSDIVKNDGHQWISDDGVLGMGWGSFYGKRILIGRTYDNKIAIMVSAGGEDLWDGSFDNAPTVDWGDRWGCVIKGYSTAQMVWVAKQLGWRDATLMATSDDEKDSSLNPNVKVNGKAVISQEDATYNPAEYANNGAAQKGAYYMTFDAK